MIKNIILNLWMTNGLVLRISDITEYDQKNIEFKIVKDATALDLRAQKPIDFGICCNGKNVYTLLSWVDGKEVETVLPTLSETEQLLNQGKVEAISLCRPLICEPDLPNAWKSGDRRSSRCVSCNKCFDYSSEFGCKVFK